MNQVTGEDVGDGVGTGVAVGTGVGAVGAGEGVGDAVGTGEGLGVAGFPQLFAFPVTGEPPLSWLRAKVRVNSLFVGDVMVVDPGFKLI
jgi:hypothetical protein